MPSGLFFYKNNANASKVDATASRFYGRLFMS